MIDVLKNYAENLTTIYTADQEMGQYQYLMDIGKKSSTFLKNEKSEQNKMYGCMAQVWVIMEKRNDKFYFRGDSDAAIVKGLVSIITEAMSGHTSHEIKNIKHNIVDQLGLGPGLTLRRQVGMMAMIDHIKKLSGTN